MSEDSLVVAITVLVITVLVVGAIGAWILIVKLLRRLFGKEPPQVQSISVTFGLSDEQHGRMEERLAIQEFAARLEGMLRDARVGRYDGDEFGAGTATLYFYGESADALWNTLEGEVRERAPLPGIEVTLLYGDYRARRETVPL